MSTCKALTKSGRQCKRQAPSGAEYCYQHQSAEPEREPSSRPEVWEAARDVAVVGASVAAVATSHFFKKLLNEVDGILADASGVSSDQRTSESAAAEEDSGG